jgi:hypothetical protein
MKKLRLTNRENTPPLTIPTAQSRSPTPSEIPSLSNRMQTFVLADSIDEKLPFQTPEAIAQCLDNLLLLLLQFSLLIPQTN